MARPRKYTDEDRAAALAALTANAGNVAKTAREVGVPRMTLTLWALEQRKAGEEADVAGGSCHIKTGVPVRVYERAAGKLDEKLEAIAHRLVDLMPDKIDRASLKDAAIALGIAVEKMRLLREQSTSNSGGTFRLEFEQLSKLPYDELLRVHRATLGAPGGDRN